MWIVVLIVGGLVAVAGGAMIGFGIPINEFSFGNTLILAGTVALVGGLLLIVGAIVIRQLRRITMALMARAEALPVMPHADADTRADLRADSDRADMHDAVDSGADSDFHADSHADSYGAPRGRDVRSHEPQLPMASSIAAPEPGPLEWLRPHNASARRTADTGDDADETMSPPSAPPAPKPRPAPQPAHATAAEPAPPPVQRTRSTFFDKAKWPVRRADTRNPAAAPPQEPAEPRDQSTNANPPAQSYTPPTAAPPRPVAILKSGVIDDMAYTLYTDGSIEAEVRGKPVRFNSIEELRAHLETNVRTGVNRG